MDTISKTSQYMTSAKSKDHGKQEERQCLFKIIDHCMDFVAILDVGQSRQKLQQMYGVVQLSTLVALLL